ncbi:hypothetical protein PVAP13_4KG070000 [Panicum virgatum]|uniref:Replication factor-A protein 1 N-terminal domain-containing protein n=1 Tax=Panicum virgatum TaxID=38727 RepID=A0A8T0TLW5_PANVG|nr:hypothetical protein PVAP13_4KG070000 [Panicum virgatum]
MGGGWGGMEEAVAAIPRRQHRVLQLAAAPRPLAASPPAARRYLLALSDGTRLKLGVLATSLNHLVTGGALRRGTVLHVLDFSNGLIQNNRRIMIDIQLEILQPEFAALIGSVIDCEPNATQHIGVSCSGGRGSHEPCFMPAGDAFVPSGNTHGNPMPPSNLHSTPMYMHG